MVCSKLIITSLWGLSRPDVNEENGSKPIGNCMRITLRTQVQIGAVLFCLAAMTVMLRFAKDKAIIIEGLAQDQVTGGGLQSAQEDSTTGELRFTEADETADYICIPLENNIAAENVTIENHYMDRQVWISIKGASSDYYVEAALSGNLSFITKGSYEIREDGVVLKLSTRELYECHSTLEEKQLYVEMIRPREVYDKIIVIDAACGGSDMGITANDILEKDIVLDIVKQAKLLLDNTDIKVYYTRIEDTDVTAESRVALANEVQADMFISIRLSSDEDEELYGIEAIYNANYYLPGFNSVSLADRVERAVVTRINGRGNGLYEAADSDILVQEAKVPVAVLQVGYASNTKEAELLNREDYRALIAAGIVDAVTKAYEEGSIMAVK